MRLVPGVRYVDLETDRGRFSTYSRTSSSVDEVTMHELPAVEIDTFPTVAEINELQRGNRGR